MEDLEKNWKTYESLLGRLADDNINTLVKDMGQRIAACPCSSKEDYVGAYPGGLVENSLKVANLARNICKLYDFEVPVASIIKVSLLHDIGKIGDLNHDYFVNQDSDWHREKLGQIYKLNDKCSKMSITHRTLFILQHYGIQLTQDEWLAIQISSGNHLEENKFYVYNEPNLGLILQHAKFASMRK